MQVLLPAVCNQTIGEDLDTTQKWPTYVGGQTPPLMWDIRLPSDPPQIWLKSEIEPESSPMGGFGHCPEMAQICGGSDPPI